LLSFFHLSWFALWLCYYMYITCCRGTHSFSCWSILL
jgi:hypothetical protein